MNRRAHLRVVAVVSVPAAKRFITVMTRLSSWKWPLVPDSCRSKRVKENH